MIRHTTPAVDKGICYGQTDLLLTADFQEEASDVLENLPTKPDVIYSSPLHRCRILAEFLSRASGVPVEVDKRLMELHFGNWEMKRWDDIDSTDLTQWMSNYERARCPGGESYHDLMARVEDFIVSLQATTHKTSWVVTHGGVLRAVNVLVNKISLKQSMDLRIPYGNILRLKL
nr:alpha-ribazole phosphatase [Chryseolinea lacunae]